MTQRYHQKNARLTMFITTMLKHEFLKKLRSMNSVWRNHKNVSLYWTSLAIRNKSALVSLQRSILLSNEMQRKDKEEPVSKHFHSDEKPKAVATATIGRIVK